MKKPHDDEPIDINLDAEPIADSPLGTAAASAKDLIDAAAAAASAPSGAEDASPEVAALFQQIAKLQAQKDDLYQTLVRRQADFENFRKRTERERAEDTRRSAMIVIEGLLPVLDAFERALAAPVEPGFEQHRVGYDLIYKQLWEGLSRHGLERVDAVGKQFDPFTHQALDRVETSDHEDGIVLEEYQRGYKMRDKIIRPSMVKVASNPSSAAAPAADSTVN